MPPPIRTGPGASQADVDAHLREAPADLLARVGISPLQQFDATGSPRGNVSWDAIAAVESLGLAADFWVHIAKRICG